MRFRIAAVLLRLSLGVALQGQQSQPPQCNPRAVVVDNGGRIFIADHGKYRVRVVDTNGIISTPKPLSVTVTVTGTSAGLQQNSTAIFTPR